MVLVEDECRIVRESGSMRIWYKRGTYPEIRVDQKKEGRSFYGALNVKTGRCHLWDTDKQNSAHTVYYLKQLEDRYQGKEVLLIWDGAPSHRGAVKQYLTQLHQQKRTFHTKRWKLQLMYFPPYWPKLNPQERIWKRGKEKTTHNSEDSYEDKLYTFRQFVTKTIFTTHFLKKYS